MKEKKRLYKTRGVTRILGEVREMEINEREGERESHR